MIETLQRDKMYGPYELQMPVNIYRKLRNKAYDTRIKEWQRRNKRRGRIAR